MRAARYRQLVPGRLSTIRPHQRVAISAVLTAWEIINGFYADEEFRRSCLADWPDDDMPAHEDPRHDRDRFLPVPRW
jgi:hypothetical protein